MRIAVKVIPNAKKNEAVSWEGGLKVYLNSPPIEGRANKALVEFLADYYQVKKHQIQITKGLQSRNKTINIEGI